MHHDDFFFFYSRLLNFFFFFGHFNKEIICLHNPKQDDATINNVVDSHIMRTNNTFVLLYSYIVKIIISAASRNAQCIKTQVCLKEVKKKESNLVSGHPLFLETLSSLLGNV